MDLMRFFLVSYHWLVGVSVLNTYRTCNDTFLSSIVNGSISSKYIFTAAATCVFWPNQTKYNHNLFVGVNITQGCPAMNHCSNQTLWINGTLPISNGTVPIQICESGASGCCKNNTITNVNNCTPYSVYFHNTSKGCNEVYCYVNGQNVKPTPGQSTIVVLPTNTGNGTSGHTASGRLGIMY